MPEFRADITEYTAEVGSDVDTLNILAVPQIEGAIVTIEGNENLSIGENVITVLVTAKDRNHNKNIHNKSKKKITRRRGKRSRRKSNTEPK